MNSTISNNPKNNYFEYSFNINYNLLILCLIIIIILIIKLRIKKRRVLILPINQNDIKNIKNKNKKKYDLMEHIIINILPNTIYSPIKYMERYGLYKRKIIKNEDDIEKISSKKIL